MKRFLVLSLGLTLAACGTPQQQCINQVTRDLRIVQGFIAEAEANLARGYAIAEVVETHPKFVDCTPEPTATKPDPKPRKCLVDVAETVKRPVAIDLDAERAKLASLEAKRAELNRSSAAAVAACQRQYPE